MQSSAFTLGWYLAVRPTVGVGRVVVGRVLPRHHVLLAHLAHVSICQNKCFRVHLGQSPSNGLLNHQLPHLRPADPVRGAGPGVGAAQAGVAVAPELAGRVVVVGVVGAPAVPLAECRAVRQRSQVRESSGTNPPLQRNNQPITDNQPVSRHYQPTFHYSDRQKS